MDAEATELTVRACLAEARIRLDKAAGIARAADACAGAGFSDKAVEITLDIEQPLYEATTLLNAVSLINRIRKVKVVNHEIARCPRSQLTGTQMA